MKKIRVYLYRARVLALLLVMLVSMGSFGAYYLEAIEIPVLRGFGEIFLFFFPGVILLLRVRRSGCHGSACKACNGKWFWYSLYDDGQDVSNSTETHYTSTWICLGCGKRTTQTSGDNQCRSD
jgi:hypothetical protein